MFERLLILSLVLLLSLLALKILLRAGKINLSFPGLRRLYPDNNRPTLLYFWSESCTPCYFQSRIISRLKENYKNINFISLNALEKNEAASEFNIRTVPSIALISSSKKMKFLNQGFTGEEILKKELDEID